MGGTYCVTADDFNGHHVSACSQYTNILGQNIFCAAQIKWNKQIVTQYDHQWLSAVNILYTDPQGEKWSGFEALQSNSQFEIKEISDYQKNKIGLATKIITAQFSVNVSNGNQTKRITGTSTFSVAAPE
ncbi:MAG TPA: hypothetical protein ENK85_11885 [Saprospiraceae bacterium]|nr:hypothetical protein [Saprospiraceae bacterium]